MSPPVYPPSPLPTKSLCIQAVSTELQFHTRGERSVLPGFIYLASLFSWEGPHGTQRPRGIDLPPTRMMETLQVPNGSQLMENLFIQPLETGCLRLCRNQASDPTLLLPKKLRARVITSNFSHDSCLVRKFMAPLGNSEK